MIRIEDIKLPGCVAVVTDANELQMLHDAITSHLCSGSDELHDHLMPDFLALRRQISRLISEAP